MVLLASAYDHRNTSRRLISLREKKLRIKARHRGVDRDRRRQGAEARRLVHQR